MCSYTCILYVCVIQDKINKLNCPAILTTDALSYSCTVFLPVLIEVGVKPLLSAAIFALPLL